MNERWMVVEKPGYQGGKKDDQTKQWNEQYGESRWRLRWILADGRECSYDEIFWTVYVPGYVRHFLSHSEEARFITKNFSYGYDLDFIPKQLAFDHRALYDKPGVVNQFHHVAFNMALEFYLGYPFQGLEPLQVRQGKRGVPEPERPRGWRWGPGRIVAVRRDLIPQSDLAGWWGPDTIEDLYQKAKVLQVLY